MLPFLQRPLEVWKRGILSGLGSLCLPPTLLLSGKASNGALAAAVYATEDVDHVGFFHLFRGILEIILMIRHILDDIVPQEGAEGFQTLDPVFFVLQADPYLFPFLSQILVGQLRNGGGT